MSHPLLLPTVESGGGRGYGEPLERDIEKVERDVPEGYVPIEETQRDYGVWFDPNTRKADRANTEESREKLKERPQGRE